MIRFLGLRDAFTNGSILFSGTIRKESLLITLGENLQPFSNKEDTAIDPYSESDIRKAYGTLQRNWTRYDLKPQEFVLCSGKEQILLDANHFGLFTTLSHVARLGVMSSPSSFFIDPEFSGHITFELYNFSPCQIRLTQSMPIAKVIIFECQTMVDINKSSKHMNHFYYGKEDELRSLFFREFTKVKEGR